MDRSACCYQGRHADWPALRERLRVLAASGRREMLEREVVAPKERVSLLPARLSDIERRLGA